MARQPTAFQKRVYALARLVPRGRVTTYGAIARALGTSPRAVGQALRHNPYAPHTPCHRVVASDGSIGGYAGKRSGKKIREKIALLRKEGVIVRRGKVVDFQKKRHRSGMAK